MYQSLGFHSFSAPVFAVESLIGLLSIERLVRTCSHLVWFPFPLDLLVFCFLDPNSDLADLVSCGNVSAQLMRSVSTFVASASVSFLSSQLIGD